MSQQMPRPHRIGQTLAVALCQRGYHAEAFAPTAESRIDVVNVYYDPHDRYPAVSICEPFGGDGWQWGDNYQHNAPADIAIDELADRVIDTVLSR